MLKTDHAVRKLGYMIGAAALLLGVATGSAQAQFNLPNQGLESTGQNVADYNPQQKEAIALVEKWIDTSNAHDQAAHLATVGDNVAFRADPLELLQWGKQGYCSAWGFVADQRAWLGIDNLYVVGGPNDSVVLMKRRDINGAYDGNFFLGGMVVPLAVMVRVHNGKVVEWYDMPINKVSIGALGFSPPGIGEKQRVADRCKDVVVGGDPNPDPNVPTPDVTLDAPVTWGTNMPEFFMSPEEQAALQTVRSFFAAREAGNPNLLAATFDINGNGRPNPKDELIKGRDAVLQNICSVLGGTIDLTGLYAVGADYNQAVLAGWTYMAADGTKSQMASFFRLKDAKIVEWMDSNVDGAGPAADANSAACQQVNARIEAAKAAAAAPGPGGPPGAGGPPAGAPPAGAPPA